MNAPVPKVVDMKSEEVDEFFRAGQVPEDEHGALSLQSSNIRRVPAACGGFTCCLYTETTHMDTHCDFAAPGFKSLSLLNKGPRSDLTVPTKEYKQMP